jgi:hypothetical protein
MLLEVDLDNEESIINILKKKEGLDRCFSSPIFLELFTTSAEIRNMVDRQLTENQNRIKDLLMGVRDLD